MSTPQPVLVLGSIAASLLVVSNGLPLLTPDAFDWTGPAVGLVGLAITAGVTFYTRGKVTPNESVAASVLPSGAVVAGPAAPQPDGTRVKVEQDLARGPAYGEPFDNGPMVP